MTNVFAVIIYTYFSNFDYQYYTFILHYINAYNTLYTVLFYILRSAAPFLPIITESIWQKRYYI
ncbi:class I tRNA ligase family protein [Neoehrlichia mikurensis]|uniref:class I tRNA ligase family protein n=1 Tax=Neoehrlichia mikurensis TaxID=89586 RepID=UPI001C43EA2B|nr:class I tRNA ligase family protein [Neoehrlichia mikurensis]QXK92342.1 class I tRNA ligase family protein [Neoehrlichia mikurensis]QXK93187.1 class I tRNA ligase family protein [Neoehrlichia mikurensis]QXK94037.1 class I tRNA ligase family protein [Neoehrlichia mikurensis]